MPSFVSYWELLDSSPIGLAIVSIATGQRLFVNQQMMKIFGAKSAEELITQSVTDSWIDSAQHKKCLEILNSGKEVRNFEVKRRRLDGSICWISMNVQLIEFEGEKARAVWHSDITEQKSNERAMAGLQSEQERMVDERTQDLTKEVHERRSAEQALEAERRVIKMAIETISEGIIVRDSDDNIVLYNEKLPELLGVPIEFYENNASSGELVKFHNSQNLFDKLSAEDNTKITEWIDKRLRGERVKDFNYQRAGIDGKSLLVNFRSMERGYEIRTFQDITDLKRQETELRNHRDRLENLVSVRTAKLERAKDSAEKANRAKTEFLAHMSHELRTPLNAIVGFTQMLTNNIYGPLGHEKYQEYSGDIHRSGEHLMQVINDLLDISKVEAGELELHEEEFSMVETIRACIQMIKVQEIESPERITVCEHVQDIQLKGDVRIFRQIVLNLLSNSAKFTPPDGDITIHLDQSETGGVVVSFSDTGCGIAKEDIQKVLIPFAQSRSDVHLSYEGTGLGLTLAKSLTELHGGTLNLSSELGVGTTVTLSFPPERTELL